jgi:uncharacterized membrane protein YqjE
MSDMLKNPFIGSGFATLVILVIIILDHKYNNNTRTNKQYMRITVMIYITLFCLIHFVYHEKSFGKQTGGSYAVKDVESMLIGRPDF